MRTRLVIFCLVVALAASTGTGRAADTGDALPSCRVEGIEGTGSFDVAGRLGKVVYVDFWASWCGPCAESFPFLDQLQRELGARGLEVIGVNLDEDPADATAFLRRHTVAFTLGRDPDGRCARSYGVKAMPSSYLVDRQGVIRQVHLGFKAGDRAALRERLLLLLDAGDAAR